MSKEVSSSSSSGIGFTGLLTIAFVVLKLTHYIDWSWWWVLSPLWIMPLVLLALIAIIIGGGLLVAAVAAWIDTR